MRLETVPYKIILKRLQQMKLNLWISYLQFNPPKLWISLLFHKHFEFIKCSKSLIKHNHENWLLWLGSTEILFTLWQYCRIDQRVKPSLGSSQLRFLGKIAGLEKMIGRYFTFHIFFGRNGVLLAFQK